MGKAESLAVDGLRETVIACKSVISAVAAFDGQATLVAVIVNLEVAQRDSRDGT
jgi:hypothetical protein